MIVPITPKGSKEERCGANCYVVNQGGLWLPKDAPWLADWEKEVGGFPLAILNDQPDALSHCLDYAIRPSQFRPRTTESVQVYDALEEDYNQSSSFKDMDRFDSEMNMLLAIGRNKS
jgi:hypothetical protein